MSKAFMYLIDEDNKARASHLQSHFTCLPCQVENKMQYHPHFAAGEKGRHREGGGPATRWTGRGQGWSSGHWILFPALPLACWGSLGSCFPSHPASSEWQGLAPCVSTQHPAQWGSWMSSLLLARQRRTRTQEESVSGLDPRASEHTDPTSL